MSELKRYGYVRDTMCNEQTWDETPTGEWVKHDEAAARIRELEAEVVTLTKINHRRSESLTDRIAKLKAITDAAGDEDPIALIRAGKCVPITADGVRVYIGMPLWYEPTDPDESPHMVVDRIVYGKDVDPSVWCDCDEYGNPNGGEHERAWSSCEAAEAARPNA